MRLIKWKQKGTTRKQYAQTSQRLKSETKLLKRGFDVILVRYYVYASGGLPCPLFEPSLLISTHVEHMCGVGWVGGVGCLKTLGTFPALMVHTGTIDSLWKCLKDHVPASLCTRVQKARVNPLLMQFTRQWQWRYVNGSRDLLKETGNAMYRHYFG